MQYMLAIYEDDAAYGDTGTGEAWEAILQAHMAFGQALAEAGVMRGGEGLQRAATATTVRRDGAASMIHDGPYAETKEQLGGFYIIEVDTLDEAIAWAKKIPLAGAGSIEVRPTLGAMADA